MILKSSKVLYLFDFDGTLVGNNQWSNYWQNNRDCFRRGPYIKPSDFDIRWCILTGRPRIDYSFVKTICMIKGLTPQRIFTTPTWFYHCKTIEESFDYKVSFMKDVLLNNRSVGYTDRIIEKIYYIDNDLNCLNYINGQRKDFAFIAMSVADFNEQKFDIIL